MVMWTKTPLAGLMRIAKILGLLIALIVYGDPVKLAADIRVTPRFIIEPRSRDKLFKVLAVVKEKADSVRSCVLYFATPSLAEYRRFAMTRVKDGEFSCSVDISNLTGENLLYYIEALGEDGEVIDRSGMAVYPKALRFNPDDRSPPRFHYVSCPDTRSGGELKMSGRVSDPSGLGELTVYFRKVGRPGFHAVTLNAALNGVFSYRFPDSLSQVPGMEYYITVCDLWGNQACYGTADNPRRVFVYPRYHMGPLFRGNNEPFIVGLLSVPTAYAAHPGYCFIEVNQALNNLGRDFLHRMWLNFNFDFCSWTRLGLKYGPGDKVVFNLDIPLYGGGSGLLSWPGAPVGRTRYLIGFQEGGNHYLVVDRDFMILNNWFVGSHLGMGRGRYSAGKPGNSVGWFAAVNVSSKRIFGNKLHFILERDDFHYHAGLLVFSRRGMRFKLGLRALDDGDRRALVIGSAAHFGI